MCQGVPVSFFDEAVAARYDETSAARFHPDVLGPTVDVLADLALGGPALEFAVERGGNRVVSFGETQLLDGGSSDKPEA